MENNNDNNELLKTLKNNGFDFWGSYEKNKNEIEKIIGSMLNIVIEKKDFNNLLDCLGAEKSDGYEIAFRLLLFLFMKNGGDKLIFDDIQEDFDKISVQNEKNQNDVKSFLEAFVKWSSNLNLSIKSLSINKIIEYPEEQLSDFFYSFFCVPNYFGLHERKDYNQTQKKLLKEIKKVFDLLELQTTIGLGKILLWNESISDSVFALTTGEENEKFMFLAWLTYILDLDVFSKSKAAEYNISKLSHFCYNNHILECDENQINKWVIDNLKTIEQKVIEYHDFDFWNIYSKSKDENIKKWMDAKIESFVKETKYEDVLGHLGVVEEKSNGYEIAFRILNFLMLRNGGNGEEYTYEEYICRDVNLNIDFGRVDGENLEQKNSYYETQHYVENFLGIFIKWSLKQENLSFYTDKIKKYDTKQLYDFIYTFLCAPIYFGLWEHETNDEYHKNLLNEIKKVFDSLELKSDIKYKIVSFDNEISALVLDLVYIFRDKSDDEIIKLLASLIYILDLSINDGGIDESLKRFWYEISWGTSIDINLLNEIKAKAQEYLEFHIKCSKPIKENTKDLSTDINKIRSLFENITKKDVNHLNTSEELKLSSQVDENKLNIYKRRMPENNIIKKSGNNVSNAIEKKDINTISKSNKKETELREDNPSLKKEITKILDTLFELLPEPECDDSSRGVLYNGTGKKFEKENKKVEIRGRLRSHRKTLLSIYEDSKKCQNIDDGFFQQLENKLKDLYENGIFILKTTIEEKKGKKISVKKGVSCYFDKNNQDIKEKFSAAIKRLGELKKTLTQDQVGEKPKPKIVDNMNHKNIDEQQI